MMIMLENLHFEVRSESNPLGLAQIREFLHYRDLFFFLARRDVLVRYKQTVFGAAWAIFNPLATTAVFAVFFGYLGGLPSDGIAYPAFILVALLPWIMFSTILQNVTNSLPSNTALVSKIYFPRLTLPLASVATPIVDFLVGLPVLVGALIYYGVMPDLKWLACPLFLILGMGLVVGLGLILAALIVTYRDLRYLVTFLIQMTMFVSPVTYSSSLIPERWQFLYSLNPMVPVLNGLRWSLLGTPAPSAVSLAVASSLALILILGGTRFFYHSSDTFADAI